MAFAQAQLNNPAIPVLERQQALDRIHGNPGVPKEATTSSFWLKEPHPQFTPKSSHSIPVEADVLIIGSGITAASIAYTLLQNCTKGATDPLRPAVLMLEAREVCSGATGRNGGHIIETADEYADLADQFGEEAARKIIRFRLAHLREMLGVAEELGLTEATQAREVQFLNAYFGDEEWKSAKERLRKFKDGMPEESKEWIAYEGDAIPEEFKLSRASGVIAGPAGALWPYKFVTGVLARLLDDYPLDFRIVDHTAVRDITYYSSRSFFPNSAVKEIDYGTRPKRNFTIYMHGRTFCAQHVIHCTNAHVGCLVPGLRGRIFPVRGQMSAQTPGDNFPLQAEKHSWLFNYDRGFDYLTQLPSGQMMFGGGLSKGEHQGVADLGVSTDHEISPGIEAHLSGALSTIFDPEAWGPVQGDPIQAMWTGSMGFSADGFPWVGRLPRSVTGRATDDDKPRAGSEWVCAGFCGEGMVQAWLSGKALATMLLKMDGRSDVDLSWFPEQLQVTEERIDFAVLPETVPDSSTEHQANL